MGVVAMRIASRGIAIFVTAVLVAGLGFAPRTALAVELLPSTTVLSAPSLDPLPVGRSATIIATVTPGVTGDVPGVTGDVELRIDAVLISTVALSGGAAELTIPAGLTLGTHAIRATYTGDATYEPSDIDIDIEVGPRPAGTQVTSVTGPHDPTFQKGDLLTVDVSVDDEGAQGSIDPAGTVAIKVDGVTMATVTLPDTTADIATAAWALGTHSITAVYTPTGTDHSAATSPAFAVSLVANVVEAVQLAPTRSTFYPYKDGYKDTTSFRGRRDEAASVTVRIYSPTNKLVRTLSVAKASGAWSVAWNGKNTAGTRVAAGKYKAVQSVNDGISTRKFAAQYVVVSAKRIYTYTKTLKQSLAQRDAGAPSKGWVGWKFTLPSATVYKKLVFGVYGKTIGYPPGLFGPHHYGLCSSTTRWDWYDCMAPYQTFPTSLGWKGVTGSVTANRHGTTVKMYAVGGYKTGVNYARVVVTYGILK
jgi:hypothetical protein